MLSSERGSEGIRLGIHPFSPLVPAIGSGLVAEAEDLAALDTPVKDVALPTGEQDDGAG